MRSLLFALIVGALSPAVASAAVGTIELERSAHLPITPPSGADLGFSAAGVGDVNGDGTADFAVGYPRADENGRIDSGTVIVVFGRTDLGPIDVGNLGSGGFRIDGDTGDRAGESVSAAGDMNGDGIGDLLVGAPKALFDPDPTASGAAFLVFGSTTPSNVDLSTLSPRVVALVGDQPGADAGWSVSGGRDVNGDGKPDLLIGAPARTSFPGLPGAAFLVYGGSAALTPGTAFDLGGLGANGVTISGDTANDATGSSVALARDVSADGMDDILVGTPGSDANGLTNSGSASVIFGDAGLPAAIDLGAVGNLGRRSHGAAAGRAMGTAVAGAGDTNGDGVGDVAIFSPTLLSGGLPADDGFADVVFGSAALSSLEVGLGTPGLRIARLSFNSSGAQAAGDLDSDGRDDLLVAGTLGGSRIVYGRVSSGTIDVPAGSSSGPEPAGVASVIEFGGARSQSKTFRPLFGIGDVVRDGQPDILAGSAGTGTSTDARRYARVVVPAPPSLSYPVPTSGLELPANQVMSPVTPSVTGRGAQSFRIVGAGLPGTPFRLLFQGLQLDPATGTISGRPNQPPPPIFQAPPDRTHEISVTDTVGTATADVRIIVGPPVAQAPPSTTKGLAVNRKIGGLKAICRPFGPRIAGKRRCRLYLEFSLARSGLVDISLKRGAKAVRKVRLTLPAGSHRIDLRRRFGAKRTTPAAYTATLVATVNNVPGPAARVRFTIPLRAR